MRKEQSSLTALGIAMARAVESAKPPDERIVYDPFARRFVPGWLYAVMLFFFKTGYVEWRGPGVFAFLMARERYIDDTLQGCLESGIKQLVILGAGFDSRAYRIAGLKDRVRVFEVDHPATQQSKLKALRRIFGELPADVTYVPVDFNTQSLHSRLFESGYRADLATLFIWQGVTQYLTAEAVDSTLQFIHDCSGPGSAVVFDYIYRSLIAGTQKQAEVSSMRRYRFMSGEGLIFGIEAGSVEAFLKERGFQRVLDVGAADLKQAYFSGKNAQRKVAGGYGIATAFV